MNAVNLIPADRRKRNLSVSVSPLTLGVLGGLVVVLVAAVLYVLAVNDVRARKSELARVTANAAGWKAAANSYASYVTAAQQQKQQLADIRQLVTGRFPWSLLLGQIGAVMPAKAALSSLQATSPSADSTAAASASAGAATSSTPTSHAVQISGCAATQSAVAATMVALGRVTGVSSVSLSSTSDGGASSSGPSASAGASSSGGCPFPVTFSLSLILGSSTSSNASGGSTPAASSSSTPASSTPASSTTPPASTPTGSSATTPATGSPQ
jgi:Tfp pilus assembly protein PilN